MNRAKRQRPRTGKPCQTEPSHVSVKEILAHFYHTLTLPHSRCSEIAPYRLWLRQRDRLISSQAKQAALEVSTRFSSRRYSLWHPIRFPRRLTCPCRPPYSRRSQSRPPRGRHCHHKPREIVQGTRLQRADSFLHLARQAGRQAGPRHQNDSPQEGLGVRQAEAGFLAQKLGHVSQRATA